MYDDYELTFDDIAQKMKFSIKDFLRNMWPNLH